MGPGQGCPGRGRRTHSVVQGPPQEGVVPHPVHHQQQAVAPRDEQAQEGEVQARLGLPGHEGVGLQVVDAQQGDLVLGRQLPGLAHPHLLCAAMVG